LPPLNHQSHQTLPVPPTVTQQALPPSNRHLRTLRQFLPRNFVRPSTEAAPSNSQLHPLEPINYRFPTEEVPQIVRRRGAYASPYPAYEGQGQLQSKSHLVTGSWKKLVPELPTESYGSVMIHVLINIIQLLFHNL
jgi:hypothetical protein